MWANPLAEPRDVCVWLGVERPATCGQLVDRLGRPRDSRGRSGWHRVPSCGLLLRRQRRYAGGGASKSTNRRGRPEDWSERKLCTVIHKTPRLSTDIGELSTEAGCLACLCGRAEGDMVGRWRSHNVPCPTHCEIAGGGATQELSSCHLIHHVLYLDDLAPLCIVLGDEFADLVVCVHRC